MEAEFGLPNLMCPWNSWQHSDHFTSKKLFCSSNISKVSFLLSWNPNSASRGHTKLVTWPGPCPLISWQNSDHFTCKKLFSSSNISWRLKQPPEAKPNVSCGLDYVYWIPGKILTILHVKYFSVAQIYQELAFYPHGGWKRPTDAKPNVSHG